MGRRMGGWTQKNKEPCGLGFFDERERGKCRAVRPLAYSCAKKGLSLQPRTLKGYCKKG